jgi:hypothetical protein
VVTSLRARRRRAPKGWLMSDPVRAFVVGGKDADAEPMLRRQLGVHKCVFGAEHPVALSTAQHLAENLSSKANTLMPSGCSARCSGRKCACLGRSIRARSRLGTITPMLSRSSASYLRCKPPKWDGSSALTESCEQSG